MFNFLRYAAIASAICVTTLTPAQDSAWRGVQHDTYGGRVVLGPDGTVYFAVVDHGGYYDRVRLRAFTPGGTLIYDRFAESYLQYNTQLTLTDMDYDDGLIFIATRDARYATGAAPIFSMIASSGATYWAQPTVGAYSLAADGQNVVVATNEVDIYDPSHPPSKLNWFSRAGVLKKRQTLPERSPKGELVMAPGGNAVYWVGGELWDPTNMRYNFAVFRATPATVSYQKTYATGTGADQCLWFARLNPTTGKLYALGSSNANNVANLVLLEITADTGLDPVVKVIPKEGNPRGLDIDSNGTVVAVGFNLSETVPYGESIVGRFGAGLTTSWIKTLPELEPRSFAWARTDPISFDSQHNIFIGFDLGGTPGYQQTAVSVCKLNPSTGAVETLMRDHYGPLNDVHRVYSSQIDSLGNAYVVGDTSTAINGSSDTFVTRLQQAFLTVSNQSPFGGSNVTATIKMATNAPAGGAFFALTSSDALAASAPTSVAIATGSSTATFTISTFPRSTNKNVTISASRKGFTAQVAILVKAPVIASLSVLPSNVTGGGNVAGTATISSKAPAGGTPVTLNCSSSAASVPGSVKVPAGSSSVGFTVASSPVAADQSVTLTASTPGATRTASLLVKAPALTGIAVNPSTVTGGTGATLTATLSGNAAVGVQIQLYSGAPALVQVPANAWVSAGQSSKVVNITTSDVTSTMPVLIFASAHGVYKTTTLTLTP